MGACIEGAEAAAQLTYILIYKIFSTQPNGLAIWGESSPTGLGVQVRFCDTSLLVRSITPYSVL